VMTLAQTKPPDHFRSLSPPTRSPSQRTRMTSRRQGRGSRLTSSLLPSLVRMWSPVLQMPQPSGCTGWSPLGPVPGCQRRAVRSRQ
jgi:hypothetical protein